MAQETHTDVQVFKMNTDSKSSGKVIKTFSGTTTNDTATVIYAHPLGELAGVTMLVSVIGLKTDATEMIRAVVSSGFRRAAAGNVTEVSTDTAVASAEDSSGTPTVTLVANTSNQTVDVTITGETSKNINWLVAVEYVEIDVL